MKTVTTIYPDIYAQYSQGMLKLKTLLDLPEGAEVRLIVLPVEPKKNDLYPTRAVSWENLKRIAGIVSLGGDALADSEALYDGDDLCRAKSD